MGPATTKPLGVEASGGIQQRTVAAASPSPRFACGCRSLALEVGVGQVVGHAGGGRTSRGPDARRPRSARPSCAVEPSADASTPSNSTELPHAACSQGASRAQTRPGDRRFLIAGLLAARGAADLIPQPGSESPSTFHLLGTAPWQARVIFPDLGPDASMTPFNGRPFGGRPRSHVARAIARRSGERSCSTRAVHPRSALRCRSEHGAIGPGGWSKCCPRLSRVRRTMSSDALDTRRWRCSSRRVWVRRMIRYPRSRLATGPESTHPIAYARVPRSFRINNLQTWQSRTRRFQLGKLGLLGVMRPLHGRQPDRRRYRRGQVACSCVL